MLRSTRKNENEHSIKGVNNSSGNENRKNRGRILLTVIPKTQVGSVKGTEARMLMRSRENVYHIKNEYCTYMGSNFEMNSAFIIQQQ